METALACFFCGRVPPTPKLGPAATATATATHHFPCFNASIRLRSPFPPSFRPYRLIPNATNTTQPKLSTNFKTARRRRRRTGESEVVVVEDTAAVHHNGDPIGKKDLGKSVMRWIRDSMRAMASDLAAAEILGEMELWERMGPGLTFIMQAQPYLNAVPMPIGLEGVCLKACTHYPTLFDHFQRELRAVLQDLQNDHSIQDWRDTKSWKLLKQLANSGFSSFFSHPNTF